jgi:hypothetical protein
LPVLLAALRYLQSTKEGDSRTTPPDSKAGRGMSIELAMENAKLESEMHEMRFAVQQLRNYLAGALCSVCGEPLGNEEEIIQNDDEETMHKHCDEAPPPRNP